jgi:hypothetical protein
MVMQGFYLGHAVSQNQTKKKKKKGGHEEIIRDKKNWHP